MSTDSAPAAQEPDRAAAGGPPPSLAALFVAFAPYDAPRYALALVVEHGNAGAAAAAPIGRDIMTDVLTRDPARRVEPPARVAGRS